MRYSGRSCGPITLTLVTLLATGAARAEPYSPEAAVIASLKADLNAVKELLSQTQNEVVETRDEVDALRGELAALNARLGSTERAAVSRAGDVDVEVTGSLGQPRPRDLAEDKNALRAEQLLRLGDIAGARLVLQHSLRSGSPVAA